MDIKCCLCIIAMVILSVFTYVFFKIESRRLEKEFCGNNNEGFNENPNK